MKMPRMISASTMPTSKALCCSCLGTANLFMMIRKMNRLSTEREYSVSQPAKNSVPYWWPARTQIPMPNATAIPTNTPSATLTSLREGSCGRRPMTTMSTSRTALVMPIVSHQVSGDTSMSRASGPVPAHATYDACGCHLSGGLFRRIVATDDPGSGPRCCGPDRDDETAAKEYSPPTGPILPDTGADQEIDPVDAGLLLGRRALEHCTQHRACAGIAQHQCLV